MYVFFQILSTMNILNPILYRTLFLWFSPVTTPSILTNYAQKSPRALFLVPDLSRVKVHIYRNTMHAQLLCNIKVSHYLLVLLVRVFKTIRRRGKKIKIACYLWATRIFDGYKLWLWWIGSPKTPTFIFNKSTQEGFKTDNICAHLDLVVKKSWPYLLPSPHAQVMCVVQPECFLL